MGEEVAHEHEVVAVWDRLDELVPCEDEVGEYEEDGAEGEEAAALEHGCDHHEADEGCVDAYADADDAGRSAWGDLEECRAEEDEGAEYDHGEIAFGFARKLAVGLYTVQVPVDEIDDVPYVAHGEKAHLAEEIVA